MFKLIVLRRAVLFLVLLGSASGYLWSAEEKKVAKPELDLGWQEKIHRALNKPVTLEVKDIPLVDVVAHLGRQAGIANMVIDTRALDNVGIGTETPITKDLKGISLRNVLRLTLKDLDLTHMLRDGALVITTPEETEWRRVTKVFNVLDLVRPDDQSGPEQYDYDTLIELITCIVAPTTWVDVGGSGGIEGFRGTLVIHQTLEVLDEIPDLLDALREARKLYEKHGKKPPPVTSLPVCRQPNEEAVAALSRKGHFKFVRTPLSDVAAQLEKIYQVQIELDDRALEDVGISSDVPITFTATDLSLRHALRHMLRELDLTYVPRHGVLLITTPEESETMPVTRLYPVADLVLVTAPPRTWFPNAFGFLGSDFDSLIEVISSIVAPTTWCDVGGAGSITGESHSMTLVVAQTNEVHEQVEQLLVKIRQTMSEEATAEATSGEDEKDGLRLVVYFVLTKSSMPQKDTQETQNASPSQVSQRLPEQTQCLMCIGPLGMFRAAWNAEGLFEDEELLEVIQELVEPDSWKNEGVYARAAPGRLIIRQSPDVHRKIGQTLTRLSVFYQDGTQMPGGGFSMRRLRRLGGGMGGMGGGMGSMESGEDGGGSGGFF